MKEELLPPLVLFKFSPREISTSSKLLPSLLLLASRASLSLVSLAADTEGKKVRRQRSREDSRQRCFVPLYQRVYTLVLSSFQTFLVSITFLLLLLLLLLFSSFSLSLVEKRGAGFGVFSSNLACCLCLELHGLSIKQGLDCSSSRECPRTTMIDL